MPCDHLLPPDLLCELTAAGYADQPVERLVRVRQPGSKSTGPRVTYWLRPGCDPVPAYRRKDLDIWLQSLDGGKVR